MIGIYVFNLNDLIIIINPGGTAIFLFLKNLFSFETFQMLHHFVIVVTFSVIIVFLTVCTAEIM